MHIWRGPSHWQRRMTSWRYSLTCLTCHWTWNFSLPVVGPSETSSGATRNSWLMSNRVMGGSDDWNILEPLLSVWRVQTCGDTGSAQHLHHVGVHVAEGAIRDGPGTERLDLETPQADVTFPDREMKIFLIKGSTVHPVVLGQSPCSQDVGGNMYRTHPYSWKHMTSHDSHDMPCSRREKDENAAHDRTLLRGMLAVLLPSALLAFWKAQPCSAAMRSHAQSCAANVVRLDVSAAANALLVTISGHRVTSKALTPCDCALPVPGVQSMLERRSQDPKGPEKSREDPVLNKPKHPTES